MTIGSGLASQVGWSSETVYGTYVAPTVFTRGKTYNVARTSERPQGDGIQTGVQGPLAAHYTETTKGGTASLTLDVTSTSLGKILQAVTGGTSAVTGASSPYTHTHTLGDDFGKSLTVQIGVPQRAGVVTPMALCGSKVTSAEFSCAVGGFLGATIAFNGRLFDDTTALAAASYPVLLAPFHGGQAALKLGTVGSEAAVTGIRSTSLTWTTPHDVDNFTFGAAGLKSEPVISGLTEITGSVTADWTAANKTAFHDRLIANTATSLVWEFTASATSAIKFTVPGVVFSGDGQGVSGRDALSDSYNFTWKYDGTNLPTIIVTTSDAAL